jgi:uncharacterized protein (TIGR03083 family)
MSFAPTAGEIADRYRDSRCRVIALIEGVSDEQLLAPVPATPKWTVRDLIGHVVGCPIDLAAGHFDGAGSKTWTQAQVDARREKSVAELVAEWETAAARIDAGIRAGSIPAPVALDLLTHESDVRGAVGAPTTPDALAVRFVVDGFGSRAVGAAEKAGLPPLQLRAADTSWSAGTPGGVSAVAAEHEWARALAGRRSGRQVSGYQWDDDPAPYLDLLCPFGPLPDGDIEGLSSMH